MRTTFAAALPALALAACSAYPPAPSPYPPGNPQGPSGGMASYRAVGTEPFWGLDIGAEMTFTDGGNGIRVVEPTPTPINGVAGEIYQTPRINANIVHAPCTDGMSDRTYPDQVQVRVDGRDYRGCGAPLSWSGWSNEGRPTPPTGQDSTALTGTNWRVSAINGQPTPAGEYYMNFMPDNRLQAKLGCNGLGAGYTQTGASLSVGAIIATRMACPVMTFENQGSAVLARPLTISGYGPQVTLSSSAGTIVLTRD